MSKSSSKLLSTSLDLPTGQSACSSVSSVTNMAVASGLQRIENELRCPACRRYMHRPILLPCGHSMCYSCTANTALLPSTDPTVAASLQAVILHQQPSSLSSEVGVNSSASSASSVGQALTPNSGPGGAGDSDRLSVTSETDSGVVVNTSRPGSYLASRLPVIIGHLANIHLNQITHGLFCHNCNRIVGLYESDGLKQLPRNRALERLILKYVHNERLSCETTLEEQSELSSSLSNIAQLDTTGSPLCQLCEDPTVEGENEPVTKMRASPAVCWCEQCQVFYCQPCRERCHPPRGPLMRHLMHSAHRGLEILRERFVLRPPPCVHHRDVPMRSYCITCQTVICQDCLITEPSTCRDLHGKHEVQSLSTVCKAKKTELSQVLQTLSERARIGTDCIQRIRANMDTFSHQLTEGEQNLLVQLNTLITTLETKRTELTELLRETKEVALQQFREQISLVTSQLTKSTSMIQFCVELLKESDHSAFLVVAQSLIQRAQEADQRFIRQLEQCRQKSPIADSLKVTRSPGSLKEGLACSQTVLPHQFTYSGKLVYSSPLLFLETSNIESIRRAINDLQLQTDPGRQPTDNKPIALCRLASSKFTDLEGPPVAPIFRVDECISEGNIITLVWQPCSSTPVERYTLELDDGAGGNFRKVYRGEETICTVEGLHFRSAYQARVKAQNQAGDSPYSDRLSFHTTDLTWFHLDMAHSSPEILLTNGNRTVTSQSAEDRVILGSTGLSRGIHYWEFTVDRCDLGSQPAFGIACQDCNKQTMLGLDVRGWSAYFNHKRSWFLHNGEHFERCDGGLQPGSVIGIRLDCQRGSLSYYLNDDPHGPIAFTHLPSGVYYPAVSVSRGCQLTLHVGLEAPSESEDSDEDGSSGRGMSKSSTGREDIESAGATVVPPMSEMATDSSNFKNSTDFESRD